MNTDEQRLLLCHPGARDAFRAALADARGFGADPYFEANPWRTPELQAELVAKELSQRMDSAHTFTLPDFDGRPAPASKAIHVISRAHFYFATEPRLLPHFAVRVAAAALAHGLVSGALWGPRGQEHREKWSPIRAALVRAIMARKFDEAEQAFLLGREIGACWDVVHWEWSPPG